MRSAEAEQALERALATRRELLGDAHPHVAATGEALAAVSESSATKKTLRSDEDRPRRKAGGQPLARSTDQPLTAGR